MSSGYTHREQLTPSNTWADLDITTSGNYARRIATNGFILIIETKYFHPHNLLDIMSQNVELLNRRFSVHEIKIIAP